MRCNTLRNKNIVIVGKLLSDTRNKALQIVLLLENNQHLDGNHNFSMHLAASHLTFSNYFPIKAYSVMFYSLLRYCMICNHVLVLFPECSTEISSNDYNNLLQMNPLGSTCFSVWPAAVLF